jgi:very-short-patch-repair endonuclease
MQGQNNKKMIVGRVPQRLRRNATEAERALWNILRGGQFKGSKFRRQHAFGDYVLDFVCLPAKLVIEVDGGQHAEAVVQDAKRTRFLIEAGFGVLRFWNNEVLLEREAVMARTGRSWSVRPHPHLNPPLEGEGVFIVMAKGDGCETISRLQRVDCEE